MRQYNPAWFFALLLAFSAVAVLVLWLSADRLKEHRDALIVIKDAVSILGVVAVIAAALGFLSQELERRRAHALTRVQLSLQLMSRYYEDSLFDELRPALWSGTELPRALIGRLRVDELRFLNYLEGVAIAVEEGVIDMQLVDRMLGTPIRQLTKHPLLGPFCLSASRSYEGIRYLSERLGSSQATPTREQV